MQIDFGPTQLVRIRELTEDINEEETTLFLFFKLSPDMFCIADQTGYFRRVNKAWETTLGWTEDELLAVPFIKFVHPDDVLRTRSVMRHMEYGNLMRFYNRYRIKPGTVDFGGTIAGDGDYAVIEWNATVWRNGLTYAAARQVPMNCVNRSVDEYFGWLQKRGLLNGSTTKTE
jgi:PAS domain S-box-containing protein